MDGEEGGWNKVILSAPGKCQIHPEATRRAEGPRSSLLTMSYCYLIRLCSITESWQSVVKGLFYTEGTDLFCAQQTMFALSVPNLLQV